MNPVNPSYLRHLRSIPHSLGPVTALQLFPVCF
jgi:hypothetical protein